MRQHVGALERWKMLDEGVRALSGMCTVIPRIIRRQKKVSEGPQGGNKADDPQASTNLEPCPVPDPVPNRSIHRAAPGGLTAEVSARVWELRPYRPPPRACLRSIGSPITVRKPCGRKIWLFVHSLLEIRRNTCKMARRLLSTAFSELVGAYLVVLGGYDDGGAFRV